MPQHLRRRRTVRWAILRHGDDQITKSIQVRLREPQLRRFKLVYRFLQDIHNTAVSRRWCCDVFSYASPKTGFESGTFRPLLTVYSRSRGMILPFLWQMSKGVNPIVDEFIFIVQSIPVKSPCSDYFEYLSETSIELQTRENTQGLIPYSPN